MKKRPGCHAVHGAVKPALPTMQASRRHPETPTARAEEPPPIALVQATRRRTGTAEAAKRVKLVQCRTKFADRAEGERSKSASSMRFHRRKRESRCALLRESPSIDAATEEAYMHQKLPE
jgi:hypothetical protein